MRDLSLPHGRLSRRPRAPWYRPHPMDLVPSISLRENERGLHTGYGWNPHWHQPTDVFSTLSDKDYQLGMNATQTNGGAIDELAGLTVRH